MSRANTILKLLVGALFALSSVSCEQKQAADEPLPSSVNDLVGHKVGVISGAIQDVKYGDLLGAGMMRLGSTPEILAACEKGLSEYCLMDTTHFIGARCDERNMEYCFTDTIGGEVGVVFKKSDIALCEMTNAFIRQIYANGVHAEMMQRWIKGDVNNSVMPDLGPAPVGEPLRVGITSDFPFAFLQDNHWSGLDVELAERLGRYLGRPVEFTLFEYKGLIAALETNKVDAVCAFVYITEERAKRVLFSDPYLSSHTVCFRHIPEHKEKLSRRERFAAMAEEPLPKSVNDLVGHKVAVISGAIQDVTYDKLLGDGMLRINSTPEVLAATEKGVAEYCLMDTTHFIGAHCAERGLQYCFTDTIGGDVGAVFNKESIILCEQFNSFLRQIYVNGTHAELMNRWIKGDVDVAEMPELGPAPEGNPIRVGITADFPFAFMKDNKWIGLEIELAERWARYVGRPVEFTLLEYKSLIAALETNKVDVVCAFVYITPERAERVLFSDPYLTSHTVCFKRVLKDRDKFFVRVGKSFKYIFAPKDDQDVVEEPLPTCVEDLVGHKVAVISGAIQDVTYDKLFGDGMMRINTAPEVLAAGQTGMAEYCLMDTTHFIGARCEERGLQYCFTDTIGGDVGVVFNKSNVALCERYNAWLHQSFINGVHDEFIERWIKGDVNNAEMPDLGPAPEGGEPLRVGIIPDFPFAFMKNNRWIGLEIEMAERWGRAIGRPVEFSLYEYKALIAALETNKIDAACAFVYITPERAERVLFSEPYLTSHTVCFKHMPQPRQKWSKRAWTTIKQSFHDNVIVENRWKLLVAGLWETLILSFFSILFGTVIGSVFCGMKLSGSKFLSKIATVIVDIIRGIPVVVFLMVCFYIVFASSSLTARWVAIVAFSLNFASYVCETFRAGILAVDKGQKEAGLSLGYTKAQTFQRFVVPQAWHKVIPVYKSEMIALIKNTSVVGYIAIQDLTKMSDIIRSRTYDAIFSLIIISIIYFILTWLIGKALDAIAK